MGGVYDLWTGGVSDSEYLCSNEGPGGGILRRQMNFQNNDLVDGNVEEFYNLLDKGYRVIQAILRFYQKVIQPIFASMLKFQCSRRALYIGDCFRQIR